MDKFLREFPFKEWTRSWIHSLPRRTNAKGSADIILPTYSSFAAHAQYIRYVMPFTFVECEPDGQGEGERHGWIHERSSVLPERPDERRQCHPVAQCRLHQQHIIVVTRRRCMLGTGRRNIGGVEVVPFDGREALHVDEQKRGKKFSAHVAPEITMEYLQRCSWEWRVQFVINRRIRQVMIGYRLQ